MIFDGKKGAKMKKIIILFVAILTCLTAVFAGCNGSTGYSNGLTTDGEVSSNGGFAVVKGEYVYFINGVETHTSDNTYGDVQTGALVRVSKASLANPKEATPELVIPSLFVAGDKTSGFYIFGNDVYYASPVTAKNKEGEIENTKLDFVKTSLDGKTSSIVKTVTDNTTQYRYVESDGVVYLILKTVNDDSETVIQIVNTSNKEIVYTTEKIENVVFTEGGDGATVYYTRIAHDEVLDKDESFNELHRVNVKGEDEILLTGKGMYGNEPDDNTGFGVSGATITILKDTAEYLYLSVKYVDTSITTVTNYYGVKKSDLAKDAFSANQEKLVALNKGTASAATVFATTSYYKDINTIVYLDTTHGLVKYDYATTDDGASDSRIRLFYDKDLIGYTVKFWNEGYLYLTDSSSLFYRVNVDAILNGEEGKVEKLNYLAASTSWYNPEVIDNKYFLSVYTSEPYNSLIYVSDIEKNNSLTDDEIAAIKESTEEQVLANLETSISLITESLQEKIDTYVEDTFSDDKE